MKTIIIIALILLVVYLLFLLYPFYQRYWASITYGEGDAGCNFVDNMETITYGLSFDEAQELADYLHTPVSERDESPLINGAFVKRD